MKKNKDFFDYKYINTEDIYIGDIMLVKSVDMKTLEEVKKCDVIIGDLSSACKVVLAKENAILIKVGHNKFVDLDSIKHISDCDYINNCLEYNIADNIILKQGTFDPYKGQLFLRRLRSLDIKKEVTDILELKLKINQK